MDSKLWEELFLTDEEIGEIGSRFYKNFSIVERLPELPEFLIAQLSTIEKKGYRIVKVDEKTVKLAEDQSLPSSGEVVLLDREPFESGYHLGQLRMVEEGWRKVGKLTKF